MRNWALGFHIVTSLAVWLTAAGGWLLLAVWLLLKAIEVVFGTEEVATYNTDAPSPKILVIVGVVATLLVLRDVATEYLYREGTFTTGRER